jgi:hypothetical protein
MEGDAAVRWQRDLHGHAGELMPEGHAGGGRGQYPRGEAFLDAVHGPRFERLQEAEVGLRRDDRYRLDHASGSGRQPGRPGEHSILDSLRESAATRREHLADEERIAAGVVIQLGRVDAVRRGQLGHSASRQRGEAQPDNARPGRQLADEYPEPVRPVDLVVAVGADRQHRDGLQAARQQPDDVQRRVVGPVQVLQDQDRGAARAQFVEQARRDLVRPGAAGDHIVEASAKGSDVEEWAEWVRCGEGVAGAGQDRDGLL